MTHHPHQFAAINQVLAYERRLNEARAITGRSEDVMRRGFGRIAAIAQGRLDASADDLLNEWRARAISATWGQRRRLNRMGIFV